MGSIAVCRCGSYTYSGTSRSGAGWRLRSTNGLVAEVEFKNFDADFGERYPGAVDVWRRAWNEFIPFLDYSPELRLVVYTTNAIESIEFQLCKIPKNRGHLDDFPCDKLTVLAVRGLHGKRDRPRSSAVVSDVDQARLGRKRIEWVPWAVRITAQYLIFRT